MVLTMVRDEGGFSVWAHLEPADFLGETDVTRMSEAFIVGMGPTPKDAIVNAAEEFRGAVERLMAVTTDVVLLEGRSDGK